MPYIATALLDEKFFAAAYILCGKRDQWESCAAQLPHLFLAFMRDGIPDHRLYWLAAKMFQWTYRFFEEGRDCRKRLVKNLDFIDQDKWTRLVASSQTQAWDGAWEWRHPWRTWGLS